MFNIWKKISLTLEFIFFADIVAIVDDVDPVRRIIHTKHGEKQIVEFVVTDLM